MALGHRRVSTGLHYDASTVTIFYVSQTPSLTTVCGQSLKKDATVVVTVRCGDTVLKSEIKVLGLKPDWRHRNIDNVQWRWDKHDQWNIEVAKGCEIAGT